MSGRDTEMGCNRPCHRILRASQVVSLRVHLHLEDTAVSCWVRCRPPAVADPSARRVDRLGHAFETKQPSLRAIVLQLTIFSIASRIATLGGRNTGAIRVQKHRQRRLQHDRTDSCRRHDPHAVLCMSTLMCPPSSGLPTMIAPKPIRREQAQISCPSPVRDAGADLGERRHAIGEPRLHHCGRHAVRHAARLVPPHRQTAGRAAGTRVRPRPCR